MLRRTLLAIALAASLTASAQATTNLVAGDHILMQNSVFTIPIMGTSDSGDTTAGIVLNISMPANGPIITKVELINGTVFEPNNIGQQDYGAGFPEYLVPTRTPAYFTGTVSGSVPLGIVALVTLDATGVAPGIYDIILENELGPSILYDAQGNPGTYTNGTIGSVPEPSGVAIGSLGVMGLAAVAARRGRARRA